MGLSTSARRLFCILGTQGLINMASTSLERVCSGMCVIQPNAMSLSHLLLASTPVETCDKSRTAKAMSTTSRQGIGGTTVWKLIFQLAQCRDCYRPSSIYSISEGKGSTRTYELRTAINNLYVTIIQTFTILDLEVLLQCEAELPDDESDSDSEEIGQAKPLLRSLCSFLEARVNINLFTTASLIRPELSITGYPMLTRLVGHLRLHAPSGDSFKLIPSPGSVNTPFLFNISEDTTRAAAFQRLQDPKQKRPDKKTRRLMLEDVAKMDSHLLAFNNFVMKFKTSVASLESLAEQPSQNSTSSRRTVSFGALQKFRQKASNTFRAVFSGFTTCAPDSDDHKIFLQFPRVEDIFNCQLSDAEEFPVQLFFKSCLHDNWQPADAYFLPSADVGAYKKQAVCRALGDAYGDARHLELRVFESPKLDEHEDMILYVPKSPRPSRRYDDDFKLPDQPDKSLLSLVKGGYFASTASYELLVNTSYEGDVFELHQRKSLALKVILGLMLSMDSAGSIGTWDPQRMHSFLPVVKRTEDIPIFVSIKKSRQDKDSSKQEGLSILDWALCMRGDSDSDLQPLPPFTFLAKVLMQIARGETLEAIKLSYHPKDDLSARRKLGKLIDYCCKDLKYPEGVQNAAFVAAAYECLKFHVTYQEHARKAPSENHMLLAWRLVFDYIISKIDGSFLLQECTTGLDGVEIPVAGCLGNATGLPVDPNEDNLTMGTCPVALFDGENVAAGSREKHRADGFFRLLDSFHNSYSSFVVDQATGKKVEPPRRIRIAVLDTGIDFRHAGIKIAEANGRIKKDWCHSWVGTDTNDEDDELHGTNCANLLHKAAPEADIYVGKVFAGTSVKSYEAVNIAKAINHAVNEWEVDIISMSFGLRPPMPSENATGAANSKELQDYKNIVGEITEVISKASAKTIMFAAASNDGLNDNRSFPASLDPIRVICVHASDGNGNDGGINPAPKDGANLMTLGIGVELMTRSWVEGGNSRPRMPRYKKVYKSGTSFATPIAAGVAGTVLDLAMRVSHIEEGTEKELRTLGGMSKLLSRMSRVKEKYSYLAPWNLWVQNWQANDTRRRMIWDTINDILS